MVTRTSSSRPGCLDDPMPQAMTAPYTVPTAARPLGGIVVFAVSFALYALLHQHQPYGDGISYLVWLREGRFVAHHLLYLPDLWLFTRPLLALGIEEKLAATLFQAFCAAAGSAFLWTLLAGSRRLVPGVRSPLLFVALVALSPVLLFYATTVENHAHHYFWICLLLLTLERALRRDSLGAWLLAGLALLGAYGSHSSCLLLLPALVLFLHWQRHGSRLCLPGRGDLVRLLAFGVPALLGKLLEPHIQYWLSGEEAWRHNASFAFLKSLLSARSAGELLDYLWAEVVVPAPALWAALVVLSIGRPWRRLEVLGFAGLAVLPYFLVFGHWPVREFGAYYVAALPFVAVILAHVQPAPDRMRASLVAVLIAGQAAFGGWYAATWVSRQTRPAWEVAADAAALAGPEGTVLFWRGLPALHATYDHGVAAQPLENWILQGQGPASLDPEFWSKFAELFVSKLEQAAAHGPVLLGAELVERIAAAPGALPPGAPDLRPLAARLRQRFRLLPVVRGAFFGVRLERLE